MKNPKEVWGSAAVIAVLLLLFWPSVRSAFVHQRIGGLYHVSGSFADWRFGDDGTFSEEGVVDSHGRYDVIGVNRIRIAAGVGGPVVYGYEFVGSELILKSESGGAVYHLKPKKEP